MKKDQTGEKPGRFQAFWRKNVWNSEFRGTAIDFGSGRGAIDRFLEFMGGGKEKDSGQIVTPETATRITVLHNCLNTIAQDIATFPPKVRKEVNGIKETVKNNFSKVISHRPNPYENAWHFWFGMIYMGEGWGSSYAYVAERDRQGYATKLLRLKPWIVIPKMIDGDLYYEIDGKIAIHSRDIYHYRSFVTDSPFGESKVEWNNKAIGLKLKEQKFKAKSLGSKPPIVVLMNGTSEQIDQSRENWNRQVNGEDVAGTPFLMGESLDIKNLSLSPEVAQIIEQSKMSDEDIMGIWRLQPAMIGRHDKSNYNVVEQQSIIHVRNTLLPIAVNLEQEMHKLMPEDTDEYVKFNFKALLRGDTKTQTEFYQFLRFYGIANADEIRALEDMPPIEGGLGADYYIQSSMIKMGETPQPPAPGTVTGDQRMLELLDDFAKKHKLNGYAKLDTVLEQ